jgi:hypothetical protein
MSRLKSLPVPFLCCCSLAGVFGLADAQEREVPTPEEIQAAESAPLFSSHELLELTLEADFHTIRREDRNDEDSEERPAVMRWQGADGTTETQEIQIQTRGNFRLARRNCDFPPLRLNVKKEPTTGTLFEGQDKLKLVVACKLGQDYWEQYVLAEYLVYRMLNLFTPLSFRVRLARVTYIDTSGEDETFTKYAFLIEDDDVMATRNGSWKIDWETERSLPPILQERDQAILVDVFQYMIGNTDWSGVRMHNMALLQRPPATYITVPFDFDVSGIVNTRYAEPDHTLPIRSVRERLFRGFCPEQVNRQPEDYEAVYEQFREKQEELYDLWRSQEGLEEDRIEDTLEYLEDFFEILADPRRIRTQMLNHCRRIGRP